MAKTPRIPAYQLHKASGKAFVKFTANGKRRTIYLGEHDSQESRVAYARVIADIVSGGVGPVPNEASADGLSVRRLTELFLEHADIYYRKNGKPTSEPANFRIAISHVPVVLLDLPAAEFSYRHLKAARQAMLDGGTQARKTINKQINRFRLIFKWGAREELLGPSVSHSLYLLEPLKEGRCEAKEYDPIDPVDDDIVDATLPFLMPTIQAMIQLQRATGMRPGEVCLVRPCDVDRSREVWRFVPSEHKTQHHKKQRVVLIGPRGRQILEPFLLRPHDEYCFRPSRGCARPRKDRHYTRDVYSRSVNRACRRAFTRPAGISGKELEVWKKHHWWSPNRLRHSFASEVEVEDDIEGVRILLSHQKQTTSRIYANRDMSKGERLAARVG